MKRILIIPATAALLTGLSATAQDFNENPDAVNTPAQVLYTGDEANLDEMTIEQLNALQLQRLQTAGDETAASGESTFRVAEAGTTAPDAGDSEVTTEMGGPDYASKTDAMADADMPGTIAEVAMDNARFSTFVTLLKQADLADALSDDGPFTVFAPTNAAFARLDPELIARLTSDDGSDDLANLLKRHVVEGNYKAADITQGETELMTLAGTNLAIERAGDMITADHVDVVSGDIDASNGVIHAIDMVIIPIVETEADVQAEAEAGSDAGMDAETDPLGQ